MAYAKRVNRGIQDAALMNDAANLQGVWYEWNTSMRLGGVDFSAFVTNFDARMVACRRAIDVNGASITSLVQLIDSRLTPPVSLFLTDDGSVVMIERTGWRIVKRPGERR